MLKVHDENNYCYPGEHRKYWNNDGKTLRMHYFCDENGKFHGEFKQFHEDGTTLEVYRFYEHGHCCANYMEIPVNVLEDASGVKHSDFKKILSEGPVTVILGGSDSKKPLAESRMNRSRRAVVNRRRHRPTAQCNNSLN